MSVVFCKKMKYFPKSVYLCSVSGDPQGVIRAMSGTLATAFVGIICTKVARDSDDGSLFCENTFFATL